MTRTQYRSAEPPRWHQSPSSSRSLASPWAAEGEGITLYEDNFQYGLLHFFLKIKSKQSKEAPSLLP